MDAAKTIALEMLVRTGDMRSVEGLVNEMDLDDSSKKDKIIEADFYEIMNVAKGHGDLNLEQISESMRSSKFHKEFLSKTTKVRFVNDLVDSMKKGTEIDMEAYAQINSFYLLRVPELSNAIKRNIDSPGMKGKMTSLIETGYSLVFSPHDIHAGLVQDLFPAIDRWRDLVDPQKVVKDAIEVIAIEGEELLGEDDSRDFLYTALKKLALMTDINTVSRLVKESSRDDLYVRLVRKGKLGNVKAQNKGSRIEEAVVKYENSILIGADIADLEKEVKDRARSYLADKAGEWFAQGRMEHLLGLDRYKNGKLYDRDAARGIIGKVITHAAAREDFAILDRVFELPEHLVSKDNSLLADVAKVYAAFKKNNRHS